MICKSISFIKFQTGHGDLNIQIPQVFPDLILINPSSPHPVPHEFFIFQNSSLAPTNKASRFTVELQVCKIPLL